MATVMIEPSLELEDIWEELAAGPQHLFTIDDENSSDLEGNSNLQAEQIYNQSSILEFDHYGNLDETTLLGSTEPLFSEDMLDLLHQYPSRTPSDVASALESVLHEAIIKYTDTKETTTQKPTQRNDNRRTSQKPDQNKEDNLLYPQAIAEFWDGWILDNNEFEQSSSLDVEIFSIEEEIARLQGQAQVAKNLTLSPSSGSANSTPSGSPIASPTHDLAQVTIEISDEEDSISSIKLSSKAQKTVPTIANVPKKRPAKKVPSTSLPQPTTTTATAALKRRKLTTSQQCQQTQPATHQTITLNSSSTAIKSNEMTSGQVGPKKSSSKPKRKLAFKSATIDEVFKVEQVLKIKSADTEDDLIDIGDFADGIHN